MAEVIHLPDQAVCPFLPTVEAPLRAVAMKQCGKSRDRDFYLLALQCAQSLWLQGLPAQSLLLINRSMSADHSADPEMCDQWKMPYAAAAWVMQNCNEEQFIGNPRRHYQHLATRMVEPRKELRSWRAWACWALACKIDPDLPADTKQIEEEGIVEPSHEIIYKELSRLGIANEADYWQQSLNDILANG